MENQRFVIVILSKPIFGICAVPKVFIYMCRVRYVIGAEPLRYCESECTALLLQSL